MLLGHALAYNIAGQSMADGHHGYFVPLLESSGALLVAIFAWSIARVLLRTGRVVLTVDDSVLTAWAKLAVSQTLLFALLEHAEGYAPSLASCGMQVLIALAAALVLALFGRLLARCVDAATAAGRYLERLSQGIVHLCFAPVGSAHALSACVGTRRFQRPPPRV